MNKKQLGISLRGPKPVIVRGDDRASIKPGISRSTQKKMERMARARPVISRVLLD